MQNIIKCGCVLVAFASVAFCLIATEYVRLPQQQLPVIQEADVIVVGGSSGGVSAAISAAKEGAKVFLVSERSYLGEDICGTYRLWLEEDEQPLTELAKEVFNSKPISAPKVLRSLPFKYFADKPSAKLHLDTTPPLRLSDGVYNSAAQASVQYDEDVTITVDLGGERQFRKVHLLVYQRAGDFDVERAIITRSVDGKSWLPLTVLRNPSPSSGNFENDALPLSAEFAPVKARYLKFEVHKSNEAKRILLGEIVIEDESAAVEKSSADDKIIAVTPMHVKRTLEQALIKAGVGFLFASYPAGIVVDEKGALSGVVIANRSGRQIITAKAVIDATGRGVVARMAGVKFTDYPAGTREFRRVVVGGKSVNSDSVSLIKHSKDVFAVDRKGDFYPIYEYKIIIPMDDESYHSYARAEQIARNLVWTKESVDASEVLFEIPPISFKGAASDDGEWRGAQSIPVDLFMPEVFSNLYVLNGCVGLSLEAKAKLLRPVNLMAAGEVVGKKVATVAREVKQAGKLKIASSGQMPTVSGVARYEDFSAYHRTLQNKKLSGDDTVLPVIGEYDVVVVGGGTGGAPAAIGAGRQGAKTLLIEYLHTLGGVGTAGLISSYYYGNRVGFTKEVDDGIARFGDKDTRTSAPGWNPEHKSEWYRQELRKAGVDVWYGSFGAGAVVDGNKVKGVIVHTPSGVGVVLAKVVIDSTGNADIAVSAGARCRYTDDTEVAVQGAGLPPKELGARYTNTDYTFVDDNDVFDIWRVFVVAREKFKWAYDLGQLIDTRERRQIVGDFTLSPMDMMLNRTYPDTIVIAYSNFDSHGHTIHPMFMLRPPNRDGLYVRVPYRCLLPSGLDGILVTGLGVSAHRDALPVIRMQADVQNQGYAAGVAVAMICKKNCATRQLDIKELQKHLIQKGILPESVLTEKDSFPLSDETISMAVERVAENYDRLEVVLAFPEKSIPLLKTALSKTTEPNKMLIYAHILGMLGDNSGVDVLIDKIKNSEWDKGWRFTGMGQYGASLSPLDSYIIAAGRTRDRRALPAIIEKARQLQPTSEFSHFRAISLALESIPDKESVKALAELLKKPGISGYAVTNITTALTKNPSSGTDTTTRNQALTELVLARALYRCGDYEGLGEAILKQYANDLHGHYARHSIAVLNSVKNK